MSRRILYQNVGGIILFTVRRDEIGDVYVTHLCKTGVVQTFSMAGDEVQSLIDGLMEVTGQMSVEAKPAVANVYATVYEKIQNAILNIELLKLHGIESGSGSMTIPFEHLIFELGECVEGLREAKPVIDWTKYRSEEGNIVPIETPAELLADEIAGIQFKYGFDFIQVLTIHDRANRLTDKERGL